MLSITDLTVSYGPVEALNGVTISVPRGEVTAVIGANGALIGYGSGMNRKQWLLDHEAGLSPAPLV